MAEATEPRVSVIVPAYRQADHIAAVIREYAAALAEASIAAEILVIVNGADDATYQACATLTTDLAAIRPTLIAERGWGVAVRRGLALAKADVICYTNAARTPAPVLASFMRYAVDHPGTVIKANRHSRVGWQRRLGSTLYNRLCRLLFGIPWTDVNGTPKVFPRQFHPLVALTRDDDLIDAEFCALCRAHDYPLVELPVAGAARRAGRSTTNYRSAINMYRGAFGLWLQLRRDHRG
ncbi:MAG: glycosyltransferase [Chloroflexota bacterium]